MNEKEKADFIRFAIDATGGTDAYFTGFRNGLRYALYIMTGEDPVFDTVGEKPHEDTKRASVR